MNKEQWIINYILENGDVDHLNAKFVEEYIKIFNPKHIVQPYGADTCKDLNRQLAKMYKNGMLRRNTVGLRGTCGMGYPKWVYVYGL